MINRGFEQSYIVLAAWPFRSVAVTLVTLYRLERSYGCLGSEQDLPQWLVERDAPGSSHGPTFEAGTYSVAVGVWKRGGCCIFVARPDHNSGGAQLSHYPPTSHYCCVSAALTAAGAGTKASVRTSHLSLLRASVG